MTVRRWALRSFGAHLDKPWNKLSDKQREVLMPGLVQLHGGHGDPTDEERACA
jgi:hypothetical protein